MLKFKDENIEIVSKSKEDVLEIKELLKKRHKVKIVALSDGLKSYKKDNKFFNLYKNKIKEK